MKKIISSVLTLLVFSAGVMTFPGSAYAQWNDCPLGRVNDPFPGECGRYVDSDGSGFCDHSELLAQNTASEETAPATFEVELTGQDLKTKTVGEVAEIYKIDVDRFISALKKQFNVPQISPDSPFQLLHDNYGMAPNDVKDVAAVVAAGKDIGVAGDTTPPPVKKIQYKDEYNFGIISAILLGLYAVSWTLSYRKKFSVLTHRKIWNILLGLNFFSTALLGILMVVRIAYGITVPLPFNILFWHVETGIVFSIIALFHIAWHYPYFKAYFRR
jgi:hypothetical protein